MTYNSQALQLCRNFRTNRAQVLAHLQKIDPDRYTRSRYDRWMRTPGSSRTYCEMTPEDYQDFVQALRNMGYRLS